VQFKKQQREQILANWGPQSWFYQSLGQPARDIVGRAYSLIPCTPKERTLSQEYLTLALSIFARKIGAEKSHVVHGLLTSSLTSLIEAVGRKSGAQLSLETLSEDWTASFREVVHATHSTT
jgi:hypothetical protein